MNKKIIIFSIALFLSIFVSGITRAQNYNADALKTEAIKQMQAGRYGEAIDLLNRYISAKPQEAMGYDLRGICYEKRKDYENAVYDYKSALKLESGNSNYANDLARATAAWQSLLYNTIEGHRREIAINPDIPINYLEIGKSYKRLGEWATAEEWYDEYLGMTEASADEIIRYSEILAKNGHIAKGEPILKRYTEKYPNDQRLWSRYGYFTLWLGKNKIAIDAFEHSLAMKPFFKEAMDGLDQAKGKGYLYAINDTSYKYNGGRVVPKKVFVYAIDRDYRLLKKNPENNELRFKLVKELVDVERYEEAKNQLQILRKDTTNADFYNEYLNNVTAIMDSIYAIKITDLNTKLASDPNNVDIKLKLADNYAKVEQYDTAIPLYEDYIRAYPNNDVVRFKYAEVLSWNRLFDQSIVQVDELLKYDPDNIKYQLLRAQMGIWLKKDIDLTKQYLDNIISKQPENVDALIALSSLNMQQNNFDNAQSIIDQINTIDPGNDILIVLQNDLELQKSRYQQEQLFAILFKGRDFYYQNECDQAIPLYEEYISKTQDNILITREFADVNACAGNYVKALSLYDQILSQGYDYDVAVQKARTYYSMGDSINSLSAFKTLAEEKPDDFIVNMYLGDSYARMQEFNNAGDVYENILDNMNPDSSQIALIELRKTWLPVTGFRGIMATFPSYTLISPYTSTYADNYGFRSYTTGIRVDLGVTQFLSIGAEGFRNSIRNNIISANYNNLRFNIGLGLSPIVSLGVGIGRSFYGSTNSKTIANGFIRVSEPEIYSVNLAYSKLDAALVVFSTSLVGTQLYTNTYSLNAYYMSKSRIRASADFSYLTLPSDNKGLNTDFRIGKYFFENFLLGYNFSSSNFARQVTEYYSPSGFVSHALFADWDIIKEEMSTVTIGGRIGLIPNTDVIIREFYSSARLALATSFTLQGSLRLGSTAQNNTGYNSLSSYLSAFWAL